MLLGPLLGFDLPQTSQVVQFFSQAVGLPHQLLDRPVLLLQLLLLLVPLQRIQLIDGQENIGHCVSVRETKATGSNVESQEPLRSCTFGFSWNTVVEWWHLNC